MRQTTDPLQSEPMRIYYPLFIKNPLSIEQRLNTSVVKDNSGVVRKTISPITRIRDARLYASMQQVATQLKTINNLIERLIEMRKKTPDSPQLGEIFTKLDEKRDAVIGALNKIWLCFGNYTIKYLCKSSLEKAIKGGE